MSEAMLKKYGGKGLADKPRSGSSSEIILDAEEITERVMQKMNFGETEEDNTLNFSKRVTKEGPFGNYKQYGELIDQS